jgi:UMP-CMP kinase
MRIQNLTSLLFVLWTRRSSSFASSVSIPFVTRTGTGTTKSTVTSTAFTTTAGGSSSTSTKTTSTTTQGLSSHGGATVTTETDYSNYKKDDDDNTNDTTSYRDRLLNDSLSLVGKNLIPSTFGGVAYYNTAQLQEFRVLFILGGPGAGKGTQCERLTATSSSSSDDDTSNNNKYPCVHLSVGELLRAEQTRMDSPHRTLIQDCLVSGRIVPVDVSLALLHRAMEEAAAIHGRSTLYLVDGFPRNYDNLEGWNRFMSMPMEHDNENGHNDQYRPRRTSVWGVLLFTCPLAILEQRILTRAQTSGRSDDNIISAHKRFHTFQEQTMPVVELLRQVQQIQQEQPECNYGMPLQVHDIRGDLSIEQVWDTVQHTVQQFMAHDIWTANAKLIEAVETQNETLYRELCPYMTTTHLDGDKPSTMAVMEGTYSDDSSAPNDSTPGHHHHVQISNASIRFETGTKAITSYDRVFRTVVNDNKDDTTSHGEDIIVREERVWSHEGTRGWVNVHFTRTPKEEI